MTMRGRWWFFVGLTSVLVILLWLLFLGPLGVWARQTSSSPAGWTPVFTDTFEALTSPWVITDTTGGAYRWGSTAYLFDMGSTFLIDHGFWVAGGGTLGAAQSWPTGTYTTAMTTWAIAGPFTPTQKTWGMQLRMMLQNRIAAGDTLFVGLSDDGAHFEGITLTEASTAWEQVAWSTKAYADSPSVWVGLAFTSDAQDVSTGALVDNVVLAFNYGSMTYLPVVQRALPPTPTPTPTPLSMYFEGFDDPNSGWYTGPALRYNNWCNEEGYCHEGWEVVAEMSYYNNNYRFEIPLTWQGPATGNVDTWFVWPAEAAPLPAAYYPLSEHYCVEARGVFANMLDEDYQPYWAHWGIVFSANATMTELFSFQVNANHDYAVLHHHNYIYPGNRQPLTGEEENVEIPIINWSTDIPYLIPTHNYNILKVVVNGHYIDIYVNGHHLRGVDAGPIPAERIGLIAGDWEMTPVDVQIDYFKYDPNCPEAQGTVNAFTARP